MPSSGNVVTVFAERSVVVKCGWHPDETLCVDRQGLAARCVVLFVAPCPVCKAEAEQNGYGRGYSDALVKEMPPRTACPTVVLKPEPPPADAEQDRS